MKTKFVKKKLKNTDPEYTSQEIKEFLVECGKKPSFTINEFKEVLTKKVDDLTYKDKRILVSKVGWLNDEERMKFKSVLTIDKITFEEVERYTKIYPNPLKFNKYFPLGE